VNQGQAALAHEKTRRVLIIDDDERVLKYMSLMVQQSGFEVVVSSTIRPNLLAGFGPSDFVFVDMQMPGMDGIQVLEVLSRHGVKSRIVPMSGSHVEVLETAERIARRNGLSVAGFLTKPFRLAELRRILDEAPGELQGQKGHRAVPSEINIEDVLAGLERGEFDTYLQPIINLVTRKAIGYEALARWQSEKFSLVSPDRFIGLAAQNGVLPRLTQQLANRALTYSAAMRARGLPWKVSLNLGMEDFVDSALPEKLAALVARHGLPAHSLTVELTESSATQNETRLLEILARIRLKDIDLAIDDFGTSYSSLERLAWIPFTSLKIDMRFISEITTSSTARIIVESAIKLAKRLNLTTVAEGIETEGQLEILKDLGCDRGQGWLFARAMEFRSAMDWIEMNGSKETG
jgi:EAL domain-containing protein (putative c-di-GMP-specific phosphodiesterase class I)/ActR/RegA family two-component response regulator